MTWQILMIVSTAILQIPKQHLRNSDDVRLHRCGTSRSATRHGRSAGAVPTEALLSAGTVDPLISALSIATKGI